MTHPESFEAGRYRVVRLLGQGGQACVYLAVEVPLQRPVAIKVPLPAFAQRDLVVDRFAQEAVTMARAQHAGSIHLFGTGIEYISDAPVPYMVMELFRGVSIEDACVSDRRSSAFGALSPSLASRVLAPALYALADLHADGIIHRDVKPSNIMLGWNATRAVPGGYVTRLMDFGIARVVMDSMTEEEVRQTKTTVGMHTAGYSAPEQVRRAKSADHRADVYAAGSTLCAMLTGTDPFDLHAYELEDEEFLAIPERMRAVVHRATRYRPDERYPSMLAFADAMTAAAFGDEASDEEGFRAWLARSAADSPVEASLREALGQAYAPSRETAEWGMVVSGVRTVPVEVPVAARAPEPEPDFPPRSRRPWLVGAGGLAGAALIALLAVTALGRTGAVANDPPVPAAPLEKTEVPDPNQTGPVPAPEPVVAPVVNENRPVTAVETPPERPKRDDKATVPERVAPAAVSEPALSAPPPPVPEPEPPRGTVRLLDGAESLTLVAADGTPYSAGRVPPGTYQMRAVFPGKDAPSSVGSVTVSAGQTVGVTCNAAFKKCNAQ